MRKILTVTLTVLSLLLAPSAQAQGGFLLGMIVGGSLFGSNGSESNNAIIIYTAHPDELKKIDPMRVRMIAFQSCFEPSLLGGTNAAGRSLEEIFRTAIRGEEKKERTILQIARVISGGNTACGSIWFSYVDK